MLTQLKKSVDRLVIIGAPILEQVDGLDLARLVDGVIIAVTPGRTHRLDAREHGSFSIGSRRR